MSNSFVTQWTATGQTPPSMGFLRQEYWNGLPFPCPGDIPDPEIKLLSPVSPALQTDSYHWATLEFQEGQSVQFSRSIVSNSLWPHELQHARPACPSPTSRVYSNSCPLSRWCHSTISSSFVPFFSCPQSFPGSGSFQLSQLSASDGQSFGVSASTSVLPMNSQDWSPLGWTCLICLAVQGTLKSLLQHHSSKASVLLCSAFFIVQLSHPFMTTGKTVALTRWPFVDKVMSLLFYILSRLLITFLPRSLLISWLQSPSAVTLEPKNIKSATVAPSICHEMMGPDAMILVFWMLSFKPTFFTLFFHFHQEVLVLHFLP